MKMSPFLIVRFLNVTSLSEKNTKKEIIEAYQALLREKAGGEIIPRVEEKSEQRERNAGGIEGIIGMTKKLQDSVNDSIEKIFGKLLEFRKKAEEEEETLRAEINQHKKQWTQEQEEYQYATKMTRKRDHDEYELRKQTLERELQDRIASKESELKERERMLKEQEEDVKVLRKSVEAFPAELKKTLLPNSIFRNSVKFFWLYQAIRFSKFYEN